MLQGGEIFIESKMDSDCDGAPSCPSIDSSGQTQTSWTWRGAAIDALKANYYVLPSNLRRRLGNTRLALGDIAAVMYNGRLEFAVYADNGPLDKIGEGSISLVQNLGFNPYKNGRVCCGITSGVVLIVLPGSRGTYTSPYDRASVRQAGLARLNALTGGNARALMDDEALAVVDQANTAQMSPVTSVNNPLFVGLAVTLIVIAVVAVVIILTILVKLRLRRNEESP